MAKFVQIENKTLYKAVENERLSVEVGGSEVYFAPSVNFSYKLDSGNEQYFLNICDDEEQVITSMSVETVEKDTITVKSGDVESTFKSLDNGLKVERVFYTKPIESPRYKLKFSEGVVFHYQPELTEEEVKMGCVRPDNVVGSYAVYCDKKHLYKSRSGEIVADYKSGKLAHLYAPYWQDAKGNKIKGIQLVEKDVLTFPLPSQKWLDLAVLPIKLDPDFGYSTAGGSNIALEGYLVGTRDNPGEAGSATGVYCYCAESSTNNAHTLQGALYTDSDDTLVDVTATGTPATTTPAWVNLSFSPTEAITNQEYIVCMKDAHAAGVIDKYYDTGSSGDGIYQSVSNYPSTLSQSEIAWLFSVYCEYTAGGSGVTIPLMTHHYTKNIGAR